jgi:hypothetical protein
MSKMRGGGVKAAFGQCPKERRFFLDGYPKESVEGAHTVLRGSVRAPKGFSEVVERIAGHPVSNP